MIYRIQDLMSGRPEAFSVARSRHWASVRTAFLQSNPRCAVCGCSSGLNVHHKMPFYLRPDLELDPSNLITLGEKCPLGNHHLQFGHLGNWASYNQEIDFLAGKMLSLLQNRPIVQYKVQ